MWGMVIASLWMYVGFNMVYFLAALQNVRQDLREAATLDGAGICWRDRSSK
jgi:ABC-type sugar transport system permease subunit